MPEATCASVISLGLNIIDTVDEAIVWHCRKYCFLVKNLFVVVSLLFCTIYLCKALYMRSFIFFLLIVVLATPSTAQYYYNDIVNNKVQNKEYATLKTAGFKRVVLESFEGDDSPSEGFFGEKTFDDDFLVSMLITRSEQTGESQLQTFYSDDRVIKTVNRALDATNISEFKYDSAGNLIEINISTLNDIDSTGFSEERIFKYSERGILVSMTRKKGAEQIALIDFESDSLGNIIGENPVTGNADGKYYYYYDNQNRLTDVVHFNNRARRLLPDFIFTYNNLGQVIQTMVVNENGSDYNNWRYSYTGEGLPEIQKIYSKTRQLLGTIQFEYYK